MLRRLFCVLGLLLVLLPLQGQDPHYFAFSTHDGLPSSEVYSVVLDEKGRPWFATDRGVCRYDGYSFSRYGRPEGLSNNTCLGIRKDSQGRLWFMGLDGSLSLRDETGLHPFVWNSQIDSLLRQHQVLVDLAWDSEGLMYLVFQSRWENDFYQVDPVSGRVKKVSPEELKARFPSFVLHGVEFFEVGNSFFSVGRGKKYTLRFQDWIYHVGGKEKTEVWKGKPGFPDLSQHCNIGVLIYDLYFDTAGDLWVGTMDGLYSFPEGDLSRPPRHYFDGLPICELLQDEEGNFWFATLDKGIYLIPSFDFPQLDLNPGSMEASKVTVMKVLGEHLVFGTMNGRLLALDGEQQLELLSESSKDVGDFNYVSVREGKAHFSRHTVEEKEGDLVLGQVKPFYTHRYIMTLENGDLFHADASGYWVVADSCPKGVYYPISSRIHTLYEKDGKVWMGTQDGLMIVSPDDYAHPQRVFADHPVLAERINDIKEDAWGNFWISSIGEGLIYVAGEEVVRLGLDQGLNSMIVNRGLVTAPGVIWVGTNAGLNRIEYRWGEGFDLISVRSLTIEDGLPENYILDLALWQDEIWLGTNIGLVHFDPDLIEAPVRAQVPVYLESVVVNRQPVDPVDFSEFSSDQNDFSFRFLGVSMRKPIGRFFYRYRLVGAEQEWEYTNDRTVRYLNLAPGNYVFEVQAQNRLGEWSAAPARFPFVIHPHFTETLWFLLLVIALSLGLLGGLFFYRLRQLRLRQSQERKLQRAELQAKEAEITVLRNQMNPHFVFNALNSIQHFIFEQDVPKANYFLSRFAQLFRDALRFSRQAWVPLDQELAFLNAYLELEFMRFPERFTYSVVVEEEIDPAGLALPPFLFQPLLENAVKHAFKEIDYAGDLRLAFAEAEPGWLRVEIQDNGPGFDLDTPREGKPYHRSMGLKIVRDRIELLNQDQDDTQATFELINLQREGGQGTLARFLIPTQNIKAHAHPHR